MERTKSKPIEIRFLQDKPADQDFFGTHRDLAKAVASALASNPELRTIGLLGKWGSGKSTVLRELERSISSSSDLSDIQTFTFDAWEHQGEPIRRSFLESLFAFLTDKKLIEASDWQADIDLLTGRLGVTENIETPELTKSAKRILWSLTLIPFGLSLFGLDTLKEGWGKTTTAAGQFALFTSLILLAVPVVLILHHLLTAGGSRKKGGDAEVMGLIINKKVNRVKTRTIKSPEPTAIDFSQTCDRLISEVKQKNHRLLCVVDNLDRLPAQEALDMWSAIRAIFANIQVGATERGHPFVLVPMDHSALLASFGGNPTDERAKSFIDKTFDLTFRVPPPVRSDWKAYLRRQMEAVFGKDVIEDRTMYFVEKVFDSKHRTENEPPTPRVINRFVNLVAATWLARREDNFPLEIVSLFAANLEAIEESVLSFTQREDLKFFDDFSEWRDQIAALYFGVPEEKSRQVLLEGPLRQAIEEADFGKFKTLMKYPGAFKVFDDALRSYSYDAVDANSQDFAFKSAAMLEAVEGHTESVKRSWDFLLSRIVESSPPPSLKEFDQKLGPILRSVSRKQLATLIPIAVRWLSHHASSVEDRDVVGLIGRSYEQLKEKASGELPKLMLGGEPQAVINSIYWIHGNDPLESSTTVELEFSKLVPDLAKLVADDYEAATVPEVLNFRRRFPNAFPVEKAFTLAPLQDASVSVLEANGVSSLTANAVQNLGIMAALSKQSGEVVDAMIDAGHLQARLNEAINANEPEVVGVLAALAIARGKPFTADGGEVNDPERLQSMEEALGTFVSNPLNSLWNAQAAGHSPAFMEQALQHVVRARDLSRDELDQISTDLEFYFKPLSRTARHTLARKIGEDPSRVEKVGKLNPSSILVDILTPWVQSGVPNADRQCKNTVENLPADSWKSYLQGSGDWVLNLLEKCPSEFKLAVNSNAVAAILGLVDERSAALSISERAKLRRLVSHFNIHAERKFIGCLVTHSQSNTRNALALFKTFNDESDAFISSYARSDELVKLLDGLSFISPGRSWLEAHTDALQRAIGRFDGPSRKIIRDWFRATMTQKPQARANWVEMMAHRLGFDR